MHTTNIPGTPFAFMRYVSRPHRSWFFGAFFAVMTASVLNTAVPYVIRKFIDAANAVAIGNGTYTIVWPWIFIYLGMLLCMFLSWRVAGFVGMQWTSRSGATAYQILFSHLSHHSHSYFSDRFAGSLSSKISHASEGVQSLFEGIIWNYLSSVITLIVTIMLMWFTSPIAASVFLMLVCLLIVLNVYLAKHRRPYVIAFSEQATRARGYAVDAITNIAAVRQYTRTHEEQREFSAHIEQMRKLNIRQWRLSEWGLLINNIIIFLFEATIMYITAHMWMAGGISVGEFVMIIMLIINVQGMLVFIGMNMNGFVRRYAEIQEGITDIIVPHEITDTSDARDLVVLSGRIELTNVSFAYHASPVFEDLSLTLEAGERVGLVGTSGAGKSTLVSLLLRHHDIQKGTIMIDGQDIREITQSSLRQHIATVPQEPHLFHRSIRENIAYGKPSAADEEIIEVAKKAQAHDFITELAQGYDTLVGERGVKLSGGQKQRISIARAMLKNAPILILDEATSALDSESEVAIQKALHELMIGKTVIAIAHRLSTLREMDRIVVLGAGSIAESGTHEQLVDMGGAYARLWKHQAGGFLQEEEEA